MPLRARAVPCLIIQLGVYALIPAEVAIESVPLIGEPVTWLRIRLTAVALKAWRLAARSNCDSLSLMPPGSGERVRQE
jgi:hypothetical protein